MASVAKTLYSKGLLNCPSWMPDNIQYETIMGSEAYMVSESKSDTDLYGFCIPPKEVLFPHLAGYVVGFDKNIPAFHNYQQHHIRCGDSSYDLNIYNIVDYFRLCADCNPNMIDSLFTANQFVVRLSPIGVMVRDNRHLFLSQRLYHTFKGYAQSSMSSLFTIKDRKSESRQQDIEKYGYDLKAGYHLIRLLLECGDLLLGSRIFWEQNAEPLKEIRAGNFDKTHLLEFAAKLQEECQDRLARTLLPEKIRETEIKALLVKCLETHYGDLKGLTPTPDRDRIQLDQIRKLLNS